MLYEIKIKLKNQIWHWNIFFSVLQYVLYKFEGERKVNDNSKIYVTQEGYNQYLLALKECEKKYAECLRTRVDYGKNTSDDYKSTVYDTEARLCRNAVEDMNRTISRLVILEDEKSEDGVVGLGDIVTVLSLDANEVRQFKLTGGMPKLGLDKEVLEITINSPMGKAIHKSKVGETVSFKVGQRTLSATIISKEKGSELEKQEAQPE